MQPENAHDPLLLAKAAYLNKPFFYARAIIYFVFFVVSSTFLRAFSIAQDSDGSAAYTVLNRRVTFSSAIPFAICLTFAAVDWLMGLDYHWYSTMWGVYIFAGTALSSMCVLVLIITALRGAGYLREVVTLEHYHIMGKLMLAFTIFWAYIGFSQYMLIWYANIPEETIYFLHRNTASWWYLSQFMVVGHFFVPFLLLLFHRGKKTPDVPVRNGCLDSSHAPSGHLHRGAAGAPRSGRAPKPARLLQSCRYRLHAGGCLPQTSRRLVPLPCARSPSGEIDCVEELMESAPRPKTLWRVIAGGMVLLLIFVLVVRLLTGLAPVPDEDAARAAERAKARADLQAENAKKLEAYAWVDQAKGTVQIPIARAMELVIAELNSQAPAPAGPIATPAPSPEASPGASPSPTATPSTQPANR